jgi:CubicO group peptidase (beta-lactamase class C family)
VCDAPRAPIRVGCIAKLFTAMLARHAFEKHRLAPDEQVSDLLRAGAARRALRGITVRQLLEHTHGLDDSLLSAPPRDSRGRIDADALVHDLRAVPRLATPGTLYSYGNAGACVVAALLERLGCRQYGLQLVETLLEPLGIGTASDGKSICPATGGELALDASDLLNLVAEAVFAAPDVWPDEECAGDCGFATSLSGWNPLERGVYLGWKYHGSGWLGHQSVWPGHSVLVRAHPRRKLALIAASSEQAAAVVAARVFGAYLPELFELQVPARPNAALGLPTGVFRSAAWRVDIRQVDGESALRARRSDGTAESSAILRAVLPGLWLTRPVLSVFPHVELVALDRAYLWNGRFVLPRLAN